MLVQTYNKSTAARIRSRAAKRGVVYSDTMMRKTCIVKDMNGRDIDRKRVECSAAALERCYEAARAEMVAKYPRAYIFCDASDGVVVS